VTHRHNNHYYIYSLPLARSYNNVAHADSVQLARHNIRLLVPGNKLQAVRIQNRQY
jgi:hypothetical protein